jgi:hypothetical protein
MGVENSMIRHSEEFLNHFGYPDIRVLENDVVS